VSLVRKRESAKRDLIAQWVYYAENADIDTTDRFLAAAEATASMLAAQPDAGYRCAFTKPELKNIRRFPVTDGFEKILLFYLPQKSGIELIRAVHGNRNLNQLLQEGFFG
jgi:toxin ParE1/3/4